MGVFPECLPVTYLSAESPVGVGISDRDPPTGCVGYRTAGYGDVLKEGRTGRSLILRRGTCEVNSSVVEVLVLNIALNIMYVQVIERDVSHHTPVPGHGRYAGMAHSEGFTFITVIGIRKLKTLYPDVRAVLKVD